MLPVRSLGVAVPILVRLAVESDLVGHILALDFPGVAMVQPEVGDLNLVAILNNLLEDAIVVPDSVAPGRDLEGGKRVKEASCESTEASVSKGSVSLLLVELFEVVANAHEGVFELALEVGVDECILESSPHEELEGEIIDSFGIIIRVELLCVIP